MKRKKGERTDKSYATVGELLSKASREVKDRYSALRDFILNLGDEVQEKELHYYFAFKRIKNFVSVQIHPKNSHIILFLKLDPKKEKLEKGFSRDVTKVGHQGTGDLEITIKDNNDMEKAKVFILKSYEMN